MNFFDLHCDTPYKCFKYGTDFEVLANFNSWHQCFAVWIKDDCEGAFSLYKTILNDFKGKLAHNLKKLTPYFTVEGGSVLQGNLDNVHSLKADDIKALTLTWNGENSIASGAYAQGGLKPFGKAVIEELNRIGIACDLSHLNKQSFFEAIVRAKNPIATHSCCCAVKEHPRNLSDEQIKLLAECGGILGICLYPEFLGDGDIFENVYKNIFHLLDMGFEDVIAIGSDFDGADMDIRLKNVSDIPALYEYLGDFGIGNAILEKIFFKNAYNFFSKL